MHRNALAFLALAVTMIYGVGFALFDTPSQAYAVGGALLVALCWIAVGALGRHHGRQLD